MNIDDTAVSFDNNQNLEKQESLRTNFFISVGLLFLQVFVPGLTLYFLTSRDFSFAFQIPLWLMLVLALSLLLLAIVLTVITYWLNWNQLDQFTYVVPFCFVIIAFYLTSYWLPNEYFLVRFIVAFVAAVIGIFLTSIALLLIVRHKQLRLVNEPDVQFKAKNY